MGEIFRREKPEQEMSFTGERLTSGVGGQIELEHFHRYFLARELCRAKDVLDIASGEGYGTAFLSQVAKTIVGVDVDPQAVDHARVNYERANLRFEVGSAISIPMEDHSVDTVVSFETIEHLYEHNDFLSEVRRVLRPNGVLIISTPDRDIYSPAGQEANPYHVRELTRVGFMELIGAHFANSGMLFQRIMLGSVLSYDWWPGDWAAPLVIERRGSEFFETSHGMPRAPYMVAVASNGPLPSLGPSFYIVDGYVHRRDAEVEQAQAAEQLKSESAARVAAEEEVSRLKADLLAAEQQRDARLETLRLEEEAHRREMQDRQWQLMQRVRDATATLAGLRNGYAAAQTAGGPRPGEDPNQVCDALQREVHDLATSLAGERAAWLRSEREAQDRETELRQARSGLSAELWSEKQERAEIEARIARAEGEASNLERRFAAVVADRDRPRRRHPQVLSRMWHRTLERQRAAVLQSGLFDVAWYLRKNPDLADHPDPVRHYLEDGAQDGRDPSPLFDSAWYVSKNPDVAEQHLNPLVHYVLFGARERRDPHPLFRTQSYLASAGLPDSIDNPLIHYLASGPQSDLSPHPLFDPGWYAKSSVHVAARNEHDPPLVHYLTVGEELDLSPHPLFRPDFVRRQLRQSVESPLAHYARSGRAALVNPHPLFDTEWFLAHVRELAQEGLPNEATPLELYLRHAPSASPHALFDPSWYRATIVADDGTPPLLDYVLNGANERSPHWLLDSEYYKSRLGVPLRRSVLEDYLARALDGAPDPSPWFDTQWYVSQIGDTDGLTPLEHYVRFGMPAGLPPAPHWSGSGLEVRRLQELYASS